MKNILVNMHQPAENVNKIVKERRNNGIDDVLFILEKHNEVYIRRFI